MAAYSPLSIFLPPTTGYREKEPSIYDAQSQIYLSPSVIKHGAFFIGFASIFLLLVFLYFWYSSATHLKTW